MKITKKALAGHRCTFGNGWVSNGHYAVRLSAVENAGIFAGSPETAAAALGVNVSEVDTFGNVDAMPRILSAIDRAEPFTVSPLSHAPEARRYARTPETRLAFSSSGAVLALDRSYCALLGIEPGMILWARADCAAFLGASPHSTDRPAVDDIAAVLMPVRFDFAAALGDMPAASALSEGEESPADTLAALLRGRAAIAAEKAAAQAPAMTPDEALSSLGINVGALQTYQAAEDLRRSA